MADARDRKDKLRAQHALNGIDFVEIANQAQTELRVHFFNVAPAVAGHVRGARITGGETIAEIEVLPIAATDFNADAAGRPVLTLRVRAPGDFSIYTLALDHDGVLDRYFATAAFSFKAGCPTTLDCKTSPPACPEDDEAPPAIDYLAKDYQSFKRALTDFSAQRWPSWRERSEADLGMMLLEVLASLGDDLSYLQDRIAGERALATATERVSLLRHARLVDYEPRPATAARVVLQLTTDQADASVAAGEVVVAPTPDGGELEFETGTGLADPARYRVRKAWNCLEPWWWDDEERCLPRGATSMWVQGTALDLRAGQLVLLDTPALTDAREPCSGEEASSSEPPNRQIVELVATEEARDALYGVDLTRLTWRSEDALTDEHDLARTELGANLLPATQGLRRIDRFAIGTRPSGDATIPLAVARTGAGGAPSYACPLLAGPLAYLADPDDAGAAPSPELRVERVDVSPAVPWSFRRRLLDAEEFEAAFTIDPVAYRLLVPPAPADTWEYDGAGASVRFGDGTFGELPTQGAVFRVTWRTGGGTAGNVAADAITRIPATSGLAGIATSVRNPLPASGGEDTEPDDRVRALAPQAFRAVQYRAVLADDYEDAAETLPWVQRAGTTFRWTGSWLSVFTAVDRAGSTVLPDDLRAQVVSLLDRYRLAGYESFALAPRYASLDLEVTVCSEADAFRGDVEEAVRERLGTAALADGTTGFFHPDRFTFGAPLERSALEAAVQAATGVDGVLAVSYRWRGRTSDFVTLPETLAVARDEIVRVENDPSRPERGSLRVVVEGGK